MFSQSLVNSVYRCQNTVDHEVISLFPTIGHSGLLTRDTFHKRKSMPVKSGNDGDGTLDQMVAANKLTKTENSAKT